ncbi:DUF4177 domain-containing protein [Arenibacterium sp. CAU 1754]
MPKYEYKVVPAPAKGLKAKGVKTAEGRFALSVETVLNDMGSDGWEYLRAELLPSDERVGLTGSTTNWRNVLVFRRALSVDLVENIFGDAVATAPVVAAASATADRNVADEDAFEADMTEDGKPAGDDDAEEEDQVVEPAIPDTGNRVLTGIEKVVRQSTNKS